MAMDAQGAARARPYTELAGATFTTVVDEGNLLGQVFGFKAIPNGLLIDESGVLRYSRFGGFDIRRPESLDVLKRWAAGSNLHELAKQPEGQLPEEAGAVPGLFQKGTSLYQEGKVEEAVAS